MGTDYHIELAVGFELHTSDLLAPFKKVIPEKFHLEDRYDEKTGKKLDSVKVVDQEEQTVWEIDGEEFDWEGNAVEALAEKLDATATTCMAWGEVDGVVIGPSMPSGEEDTESDYGRISIGPDYSFRSLAGMGPKLDEISKKLRKLGVKPGRAKFVLVRSVG